MDYFINKVTVKNLRLLSFVKTTKSVHINVELISVPRGTGTGISFQFSVLVPTNKSCIAVSSVLVPRTDPLLASMFLL